MILRQMLLEFTKYYDLYFSTFSIIFCSRIGCSKDKSVLFFSCKRGDPELSVIIGIIKIGLKKSLKIGEK